MKLLAKVFLIMMILLFLPDCMFKYSRMGFKNLNYPVSMTPYIYDKNEKILVENEDLVIVRELGARQNLWGIFYGIIPLGNGNKNIMHKINSQIQKSGGAGVINFTIASNECELLYLFPLSLLPVWPGCTRVVVRGDIIKRKDGKPL